MLRALFLAGLLLTAAAPTAAMQADPFAVALAAHGLENFQTVQSLRMTGTVIDREGRSEPFVLIAETSGKIRIDYGYQQERAVSQTLDGSVRRTDGELEVQPSHVNLYGESDFLSILGMARLSQLTNEREFLGQSLMRDRLVSTLRVKTDRSRIVYGVTLEDEARVIFDDETGLVAGISRQHRADKSLAVAFDVVHVYSNYQETSGIQLPFQVERWVLGRLVETFLIDAIELNPPAYLDFDLSGGAQ